MSLYERLHSISKVLESSGRLDEQEHPDAYATVLDAMNFVAGIEQKVIVANQTRGAIDDKDMAMAVIAFMVSRLGGEVEVTNDDLQTVANKSLCEQGYPPDRIVLSLRERGFAS